MSQSREDTTIKKTEFKAGLFNPEQTAWETAGTEIAEIEKLCFGNEAYSEERLKAEIESLDTVTVILKTKEGQIIGFSYARPDAAVPGSALIYTTDIHPLYQGRGLVGEIMGTMEGELRKKNFSFMTRHCGVSSGYADKVQKHYGNRIVETYDRESRFGPQRFFKIKL